MGYQEQFREIKANYDLLETFDIDGSIRMLDSAMNSYSQSQTPATLSGLESAFAPISQYYSNISNINDRLQTFLDSASKDIVNAKSGEERYDNRVYPYESSKSREVMRGIVPELRLQTIPYLLAASVFMASVAIFMIFQMGGVTGQLNLPPALVAWWATPSAVPFYMNHMILGGFVIILIIIVITLSVLYSRVAK